MTRKETILFIISIVAFILGVINFIVNYRYKIRSKKIQERNDRIEVDNLLDKVFECLYGKEGYDKSKDITMFHEAESALQIAKNIDNTYSRVIEYEGLCLDSIGKYDLAEKKYLEALKLKPLRSRTYERLGHLFDGEKCIGFYKKAIEMSPEKAGIPYYYIGIAYKELKKHDEAKKAFLKSLELLPYRSSTHYNLGEIYLMEKNVKEAVTCYEKAISYDSKFIKAMISLGRIHCQYLEWEDGIEWIEQAIKIDPSNSYPFMMLAAIYADNGDPENALKYNEKAIELDPKRRLSTSVSQDMKKAMLKLKKSKNKE